MDAPRLVCAVWALFAATLGAFLARSVDAASSPCASPGYVDSYGSLPGVPQFASVQYAESGLSEASLVQKHYSEVAVMARPEIALDTSQTNCPHQQSGLKNWHDPSIWPGNTVPNTANGDVTIPADTKVLVSSCSVNPNLVYGIITVPSGSELIFSDADLTFQTSGFRVQGALRIGSPTCRVRSKLTITLHGTRGAQSLPANDWVKGIYVTGEIDIHGVRYTPTWTRLARSLEPGQNVILVQDLVNWQPGQLVLVTTTELKDSRDFNRNEVFTISAVEKFNDHTSAIRITSNAQYRHYGGVEYQAEVALLSRNVVVQGDAAGSVPADAGNYVCTDPTGTSTSVCADRYLTGFGAHIMVAGPGSKGRFSGLEVYRGGQTNVLARYPIHFHMMQTVTNQDAFVRDCSVRESYFRCFSVHGTSGVLLRENVAYDAIGHCYFLEDGVEENSTFAYNFGAHIHTLGPVRNPSLDIHANGGGNWWSQTLGYIDESSTLILPSDLSASVYYITNPANYFIGNAASGGWAGFGFPALRKPVKLHEWVTDLTPKDRPLWQFKGNTAHSSGYWWGSAAGIYVGGELFHPTTNGPLRYTAGRVVSATRDTCSTDPKSSGGWCPEENRLWHRFEDTKVFLINGRGIQHWGDRFEMERFETWDTGLSMNVFGSVLLQKGLTVCRSLNHQPSFLSGCPSKPATVPANPSSTYNCNVRDRYFFQSGVAFQFYDVGQRHILNEIEYRHCNWPQFRPCYWGCNGGAVFTLLSHSSEFVPEIMQASTKIKYTNCTSTRWKFSTELVEEDGPTISGRIQAWLDVDGSAGEQQGRTVLGSARAGRWWRYSDRCAVRDEIWVCPLQDPQDSLASLVIRGTHPNETDIGTTQCLNGEEVRPRNCPVVGQATSFGHKEGVDSLDIGMNAKISGPLIGYSGGWFIRLAPAPNAGTPRVVTITSPQIDPRDHLLLAFPYPIGAVFDIRARAASWCSTQWGTCEKNFTLAESIAEVRVGDGTKYFVDPETGILYLRVVTPDNAGSFGSRTAPAWSVSSPPQFSRSGMSLLYTTDQYRVIINTTSCGGGNLPSTSFSYCDAVLNAGVPEALGPVPICSWPKPDFKLRCLFTSGHIELIAEFGAFFIVALVLYGRTAVLWPLRVAIERILIPFALKISIRQDKHQVFAGSFPSLLGVALIMCCANAFAVQIAAAIAGLLILAALIISRDELNFSKDGLAKWRLASGVFHLVLIAVAFLISYFTTFEGLRLYAMLPAVMFAMFPLLRLLASVSGGISSTNSASSTALAVRSSSSGKGPSGKSTSSMKTESAASPTSAFLKKLGSFSGYSLGLIVFTSGLTALGMYFALVIATL